MVPLSVVLPTLMRDVGKSLKVSACVALGDNAGSGYRQLSNMLGFACVSIGYAYSFGGTTENW